MIALLLSCVTPGSNQVQFPSDETPTWFIKVSAADGFVPECKVVRLGDTVEWENADPAVPANVTSLEEPPELYSPNLQGAYATWSHTFEDAGFFEYYDTNSGDPGRKVVDAYYGTVTYVGTSESTHRGAVAVGDEYCCTNLDCAVDEVCDATNTCVLETP